MKAAIAMLTLSAAALAFTATVRARDSEQGIDGQSEYDENPAPDNSYDDSSADNSSAPTQTASTFNDSYNNPRANVAAFLTMIAKAEGANYNTLFGGSTFSDYSDHPRQAKRYGSVWTSAAGRYQFMARSPIPTGGSTSVDTWDRLKNKLGLPDFSPASQDAGAIELIREKGALNDVEQGRFNSALWKVRKVWASFPSAGYGQGERTEAYMKQAYASAGGQVLDT